MGDQVFVRKVMGWLWLVVAATTVLALCTLLLAVIVVMVCSLVAGRMKDPWFLHFFGIMVVGRSHDMLHGALMLVRLLLVWSPGRGR